MLDGNLLPGRREVEHIEDDGLVATVLAAMNSTDDLNQRFAFAESLLRTVLADDG